MEGGVQSGQSDIGLYYCKTNQIYLRECEKRKKIRVCKGSQWWADSKNFCEKMKDWE